MLRAWANTHSAGVFEPRGLTLAALFSHLLICWSIWQTPDGDRGWLAPQLPDKKFSFPFLSLERRNDLQREPKGIACHASGKTIYRASDKEKRPAFKERAVREGWGWMGRGRPEAYGAEGAHGEREGWVGGRGQTEQALNNRKQLGSHLTSNGKFIKLLIWSHMMKNALLSFHVQVVPRILFFLKIFKIIYLFI